MIISHAFSFSYARMHRIKSEHTRSTIIMCMFSFYGQKRARETERKRIGKENQENEREKSLGERKESRREKKKSFE